VHGNQAQYPTQYYQQQPYPQQPQYQQPPQQQPYQAPPPVGAAPAQSDIKCDSCGTQFPSFMMHCPNCGKHR